jgi:CheY-like chemotaxis protein
MGGAVELVETGPAGTCMRVSLPCAALRPAVDEAAPVAAACRRGRVLVIDDEPDVTDIIAQFLQRHEVEVCHKGREATDKALGGDWDVILCDLMIPDRNGMEVYEAVRARRPDLAERFTFITGGVLNADVARFLRETHRPHWIKPLDFGAVVAEVDVAVHAARKAS